MPEKDGGWRPELPLGPFAEQDLKVLRVVDVNQDGFVDKLCRLKAFRAGARREEETK